MGMWSVIVPETSEVTNLITNPSFEVAATGWTAVGGSVARSRTYARRGRASLAVTPTSGTTDGVYFGTVSLTSGIAYLFSVDVLGAAGVPYTLYFANTSGVLVGTPTDFIGTGEWQRVIVYYTPGSTASYRLYVTKDSHASTTVFYLDGALCKAGDTDYTYFDGDSDGGEWSGSRHASTSTMSAQSRNCGEVIDLDTYEVNVNMEQSIGVGVSTHNAMEQVLVPGAVYLGRKEATRAISLNCQVQGDNWPGLHALRKALWNAIKPDLVRDDQAFILRYDGANSDKPLDIYVRYDSGLEMGNPDMYLDEFTLRMIAYDPYWYDIGDIAVSLSPTMSATMRYFYARIDGQYVNITPSAVTDPGSGIEVYAFAYDPDNRRIYVGGEFLNWDGIASADYIAYYDMDSGTWNALGTGTNDNVRWIVVNPGGGSIYAGGEFTTAGGTTVNYVAKYTHGVGWAAMGTTGTNGLTISGALGLDGKLYVGGSFANAGGSAAANIASWDGSSWAALGSGLNGYGRSIVIGKNGHVYVGGTFTTAGGNTANRIAYWDGSVWSAMGSGMSGAVYSIAMAPDGKIYAIGSFATADGNTVNNVAMWNGTGWSGISSGLDNGGHQISVDSDGMVYMAGSFTTAGGLDVSGLSAMWNGSSFTHIPFAHPSGSTWHIISVYEHDLFFGFTSSGTGYFAGPTTVNNPGTARAYPVFELEWLSTGTQVSLQYLENIETGAKLWFDYDLQIGERLTIDFRPGKREIVSSYFGSVWNAILRGSNFLDFYLLPGNNTILLYVSEAGSPSYEAGLRFTPTYDTADGAAA